MTFPSPYEAPATGVLPAESDDADSGTDSGELLSGLLEEFARELHEERTWEIPGRPGMSASYRVDIEDAVFKRFRKSATSKSGKGELNETQLAKLLAGHYNPGLYKRGEQILDTDGSPLTFRSPTLQQGLHVASAADAAGKVYGGRDMVLQALGRWILEASGLVDDAPEADPTQD